MGSKKTRTVPIGAMVFDKLLAMKVPTGWEHNPHLRHCRLINVNKTKGIKVQVIKELGVVIP